jgi:hypothetical protein
MPADESRRPSLKKLGLHREVKPQDYECISKLSLQI